MLLYRIIIVPCLCMVTSTLYVIIYFPHFILLYAVQDTKTYSSVVA